MVRRWKTGAENYYQCEGRVEHALFRGPSQDESLLIDPVVVVIGGGLTGSMVAWWLKQRFRDEDYSVVVIEGDHSVSLLDSILNYF